MPSLLLLVDRRGSKWGALLPTRKGGESGNPATYTPEQPVYIGCPFGRQKELHAVHGSSPNHHDWKTN